MRKIMENFNYFENIQKKVKDYQLNYGIELIKILNCNIHSFSDLKEEFDKLINSIWKYQIENPESEEISLNINELRLINYYFILDNIRVNKITLGFNFGDKIVTYVGIIKITEKI